MIKIPVRDECLWLSHCPEGEFKQALSSIHSEHCIDLSVNDQRVTFQRMRQGKNPTATMGFKPIGDNRDVWRSLYLNDETQIAEIKFAGKINA